MEQFLFGELAVGIKVGEEMGYVCRIKTGLDEMRSTWQIFVRSGFVGGVM